MDVVIGSQGRLGNAIYRCFDGCASADLRLETEEDCKSLIETFQEPSTFYCCIGIANVQASRPSNDWQLYNGWVPIWLSKYANEMGHKFVHFSTDYVFQKANGPNFQLSPYTISKKYMEDMFRDGKGDCDHSKTTILRVANLFSAESNDTHNMIVKFKKKIENSEKIVVDPRIKVYPTNVNVLAEWLRDNKKEFNGLTFKNLAADPIYLSDLLDNHFKFKKYEQKCGFLDPWYLEFEKGRINIDPTNESLRLIQYMV